MGNEKIVIFGVGKKCQYIRNKYASLLREYDIVAYLDNNQTRWGDSIDGSPVAAPDFIQTVEYDNVILMADYVKDMREQLLGLGVPESKIVLWDEFLCKNQHGVFLTYGKEYICASGKGSLLIISLELNYNGGTIAIVNAAMALRSQGYDVTVSASGGNRKLIEEIVRNNIQVVIVPAINYPGEAELKWVCQFDVVIVNVFQMIQCACEISRIRPVIWWIHECSNAYDIIYSRIRDNYSKYDALAAMDNIRIVAVSAIAAKNFNQYYTDRIKEVLPYGIPDHYSGSNNDTNNKCIFAVIGELHPRKAQLVFLKAVAQFSKLERENAEFWFIGNYEKNPYSEAVCKKAEQFPEVKLLGGLTQQQMQEAYEEISVVVCPSLEETMSMAITEGMMNERVCITTDATGMADYIEDGENGFVCLAGDAKSLYEKMKWVLNHPKQWKYIGKNARKTYEKFFTLEKFAQRLQDIITSTMEDNVLK